MFKRFNLAKYWGVLLIYIAVARSGLINLTIGQYITFIIGATLVSIEKGVQG